MGMKYWIFAFGRGNVFKKWGKPVDKNYFKLHSNIGAWIGCSAIHHHSTVSVALMADFRMKKIKFASLASIFEETFFPPQEMPTLISIYTCKNRFSHRFLIRIKISYKKLNACNDKVVIKTRIFVSFAEPPMLLLTHILFPIIVCTWFARLLQTRLTEKNRCVENVALICQFRFDNMSVRFLVMLFVLSCFPLCYKIGSVIYQNCFLWNDIAGCCSMSVHKKESSFDAFQSTTGFLRRRKERVCVCVVSNGSILKIFSFSRKRSLQMINYDNPLMNHRNCTVKIGDIPCNRRIEQLVLEISKRLLKLYQWRK